MREPEPHVEVVCSEGNVQACVEDVRKRNGADADRPHRIADKALVRLLPRPATGDAEETVLDSVFLERTARPLRARGLAVHTAVLTDRRPAHAIVDYAARHAVDLIAMTTHGRGAVRRLLAGSVALAVLRTAATPVLMYHPPHE